MATTVGSDAARSGPLARASPHLDLVVAAALISLDQHEVGGFYALKQPIQRRLAVIARLAEMGDAVGRRQHDVAGAGCTPRVGRMPLGQQVEAMVRMLHGRHAQATLA